MGSTPRIPEYSLCCKHCLQAPRGQVGAEGSFLHTRTRLWDHRLERNTCSPVGGAKTEQGGGVHSWGPRPAGGGLPGGREWETACHAQA